MWVLCALLDAGYFCLPPNLQLCSGMQLTYLETVWSFELLILWFLFLDGFGVVLSLGLIFTHLQGNILNTLSIAPKLWIFLVWSLGVGPILSLVCMTGAIPPNSPPPPPHSYLPSPFGWLFSWPQIVFLKCMCWSVLCYSVLWTLAALVSTDSSLFAKFRASAGQNELHNGRAQCKMKMWALC